MILRLRAMQLHIFFLAIISGAVLVQGPVAAKQNPTDVNSGSKIEQQDIAKLLSDQTAAWNAGDLEQFMQTYWNSEHLTFSSGGKTTRGWQATLDQYRKNYAPPKEMGKLSFDGLEIVVLESESALVLGNWHLLLANDQHKDGNFSLVMRKLAGQWKIIHDHSSKLETP